MSTRERSAAILAETVNVTCPHCGEPRPNPDSGADGWTCAELRAADGSVVNCNACDKPFAIRSVNKAVIIP